MRDTSRSETFETAVNPVRTGNKVERDLEKNIREVAGRAASKGAKGNGGKRADVK